LVVVVVAVLVVVAVVVVVVVMVVVFLVADSLYFPAQCIAVSCGKPSGCASDKDLSMT